MIHIRDTLLFRVSCLPASHLPFCRLPAPLDPDELAELCEQCFAQHLSAHVHGFMPTRSLVAKESSAGQNKGRLAVKVSQER